MSFDSELNGATYRNAIAEDVRFDPAPMVGCAAGRSGRRADDSSQQDVDVVLTRLVDIVGATLLLVAVFPFLVLLAIALQIDSPGRLFFVQKRVGYGGKPFPCMKFRTMRADAETALVAYLRDNADARDEWARTFKLQNDPRVTRLGRIVRKLSLDEFPQLINILRGDMSLVGPRPIVAAEIELYGRYFADYCAVKPGLTGLWQVSGRNDVSYDQRVKLDRIYVRQKSFAFDMSILARTIPAVVFSRGSY